MMKRRLMTLALASMMVLSLAACGKDTKEETVTETAETSMENGGIAGGYTLYEAEEAAFDDEMSTIFTDAASQWDGGDLKPVALLATQVVAGTNYCFLAESSLGEPEYKLVYVYHDTEGDNTLTNVQDVDLSASSFGEEEGQLAGGWYATTNTYANPGKDMVDLFDSANSGYTLIAPLATQVVAGTNYLMLCETETKSDNEVPQLYLVTVYEDTDGNASVTAKVPFSVSYFAQKDTDIETDITESIYVE